MSGKYKVAWLCEALMVSRSGYYDWRQRQRKPGPRQRENLTLRASIRAIFVASRRTYGSPRVAHELRGKASRNRVARLMRLERLQARQRSKYRPMTTDSRHADPIAPNRLPDVQVTRTNQVWVTDATYIRTAEGWLYLVAFLDVYSRRVVGWAMGPHLDVLLVLSALRMALRQRRPRHPPIVHSDRGAQFACHAYRRELATHGLIASMSRKGNCYDNAYIESFWSSLKLEAIFGRRFSTRAEARSAIFDYIEGFYNPRRLHSSLGFTSPVNFESHLN